MAFGRETIWGRVVNYLTFALIAFIRALTSRRPDVVVAGSDPPFSVWLAHVAARRRPVVYSLQDLHPDFAIVSGMITPGLFTRFWDMIHRTGLKRCSLVVCLGETMAQRVHEKGVGAEKIAVVPSGAPKPTHSPDPAIVAELRSDCQFLCVHAGNLGGAGAWETLNQVAEALPAGSALLFIGEGFNKRYIESSKVRLLPYRPASELASVMAAGDLQLVTLRHGMEGLVVPSKLYTALAHGRPVLAVAPDRSEVSQIVRRWDCGLVADPSDPNDVISKINWARARPGELAKMSKRAVEAAQYYDRDSQLLRLAGLIECQSNSPLP